MADYGMIYPTRNVLSPEMCYHQECVCVCVFYSVNPLDDREVSEQLLKGQSVGMILLRCQDILRNSSKSMTTYDLQQALAAGSNPSKIYTGQYYVQLFSDPNFVSILRKNSRINYDNRERKWSFRSPYESYINVDSLEKGINESINGLEINQELLDSNPKMSDWINQLLEKHKIRAIRTGKIGKCKSFNNDSGFVCSIYDNRGNKCDNCSVLRNLTLYNKARPSSDNPDYECLDENFHIDHDIKEIWNQIKLPEMKSIMEDMRNKDKMKKLEVKKRVRRRGEDNSGGGASTGRVNKISNVHIYSLDEYKSELQSSNKD
ncbi:hypothetical protein GNI_098500 [Gregarina niphandrodes]|uniref:Uncharacterized protein n=1 Tax=Gregarina niphandrodes TaxID=110365 RepID=A0A023B4Q9_GRENI|nr:hypothetical protein GNI_098500 [Gregarina niphandrodes]EZG57260.1 hypothetical protein GNI_098500 [Gregarina niphandrodes]|eukprot:XP_011131067.1 hypothetical protein GNI_098500 [Gregarina niphandrodes]